MAKIFSLPGGARIPDDLLSLARKEKLKTALVTGIGGLKELKLAYFNHEAKKYEEHVISEFLEVTSLVGNITLKDGKPFLHLHGNFGKKDLSVVGGHVVSATVFPLLEVVFTPTKNTALRRFDEGSGLNIIYRTK